MTPKKIENCKIRPRKKKVHDHFVWRICLLCKNMRVITKKGSKLVINAWRGQESEVLKKAFFS